MSPVFSLLFPLSLSPPSPAYTDSPRTTIEINVAIIAASVPCLKPLFKSLFDGSSARYRFGGSSNKYAGGAKGNASGSGSNGSGLKNRYFRNGADDNENNTSSSHKRRLSAPLHRRSALPAFEMYGSSGSGKSRNQFTADVKSSGRPSSSIGSLDDDAERISPGRRSGNHHPHPSPGTVITSPGLGLGIGRSASESGTKLSGVTITAPKRSLSATGSEESILPQEGRGPYLYHHQHSSEGGGGGRGIIKTSTVQVEYDEERRRSGGWGA